MITTKTTITSYIAGYTTIDSQGSTSTVPPSTLYVVKNVAITDTATTTVASDSATILHNFNSHGLWGVTMSLVVVTVTLVFMVFV